MNLKKKKKVIGILIFSIGFGILLAIIIPEIGWILFSALFLICVGVYMLKC